VVVGGAVGERARSALRADVVDVRVPDVVGEQRAAGVDMRAA
jgi:hypothetical protein